MNFERFLDAVLPTYERTFDVKRPYSIEALGGVDIPAYGQYTEISEKYVLTKKANLWSVHGFEHIFFLHSNQFLREELDSNGVDLLKWMEEHLVRKGKRYPEANHMISTLTLVYVSDRSPRQTDLDSLYRFKWEKDYLFTIRGHVETKILVIDLKQSKVYGNKTAKDLTPFYQNLFH